MLAIKLFGTTTVTTSEGTVLLADIGGGKPRQILEILALCPGTAVPKDHLADLLWDGRPPRCYLGTLESYLCVLRKSLGRGPGRESPIATVMRGYVLDAAAVRVDLSDFRNLVRSAESPDLDAAVALQRLEEAMGLVGGDFLAGETYATWAIREREQFRQEMVRATSLAASRAMEVGRLGVAERMARIAIDHDELAESAWRVLMRALAATGRPSEALRVYGDLRDRLSSELGSDPSTETTDIYLEILRADDAGGAARHEDAREEVRVLMGLLRQAVAGIPGMDEPRSLRALAQVMADLVVGVGPPVDRALTEVQ
jgi:pentatricopeptide repeat protein